LISIFQYPAKKKIREKDGEASTSIDGAFQSSSICTSNAKNKKYFVSGGLELKWKRNFLVINEKKSKK
jgi:hypothetical protein